MCDPPCSGLRYAIIDIASMAPQRSTAWPFSNRRMSTVATSISRTVGGT